MCFQELILSEGLLERTERESATGRHRVLIRKWTGRDVIISEKAKNKCSKSSTWCFIAG